MHTDEWGIMMEKRMRKAFLSSFRVILTAIIVLFLVIIVSVGVKPQIISGDFRRLFQTETPVTVCGQ